MNHLRITWEFHAKFTKIYLLRYSKYHLKADQKILTFFQAMGMNKLKHIEGGGVLKYFKSIFKSC